MPREHLVRWGHETDAALGNGPVSGEPMPLAIVRAIAVIKAEAAAVNAEAGVIAADVAAAIRTASDEVVVGAHDDQFPLDVFQTGSGTSSNMNVNEVVAQRAAELLGRPVHPNDHVNASQSSNDVFPSAVRIAVASSVHRDLIPSLHALERSLAGLADETADAVKLGRTHLQDAVPLTFGQEVSGWARAVDLGGERLRSALPHLLELPIGGTAVGTGLNAAPHFGASMALQLGDRFGLPFVEAINHFEAQSSADALVEMSASLKVVAITLNKIAGDLRLLSSGPTGGFGEVTMPIVQAGSSMMPGKKNPVVCEIVQQVAAQVVGNDATVTFASTLSTLQLSTAMPVIARSVLSSASLLTRASEMLRVRTIETIVVHRERMRALAERSPALATAIAPSVGYDVAAKVAAWMVEHSCSISDALAALSVTAEVPDPLLLTRRPEP